MMKFSISKMFSAGVIAATVAFAPAVAQATVTMDVLFQGTPTVENGIANFGTAVNDSLTSSNPASVRVTDLDITGGDQRSVLGFSTIPTSIASMVAISFNALDSEFGGSVVSVFDTLTGTSLSGLLGTGTVSTTAPFELMVSASPGTSPIYVEVDWSNANGGWTGSAGSFDYNVALVPLPAAGLVLLTALGGAAVYRRKQRKAA